MMAKYPDELTCDMAETYGVFDIKRVPVKLLATLAVGLRENSRVMMAKRGAIVDNKTILLAQIVDLLGGVNPQPAPPPTPPPLPPRPLTPQFSG